MERHKQVIKLLIVVIEVATACPVCGGRHGFGDRNHVHDKNATEDEK
jgi:hypothetical protein